MTWSGMNLIKKEDAADWDTRSWPLDFPALSGLTSPRQRQRSTDEAGSLSPLTWEEGLPTVSSGAFPPAGQHYKQFPRLAKCIFKRRSELCPHEVTQKTGRFCLLGERRPNEINQRNKRKKLQLLLVTSNCGIVRWFQPVSHLPKHMCFPL